MDPMAEAAKEDGNKCMKEEKYIEAMFHYTKAIKIDPDPPTYYSNRSLAFLKMDQFHYAREDAKVVIRKMPTWAKGYYRKAEVEMKAEAYEDAIESYKQGLQVNEKEEKLRAGLEAAQTKLREQRRYENRLTPYGFVLGAFLGAVLVLLDHATESPRLGNEVMQALVVILPTAVCYGLARVYRYFIVSARTSLLDPPMDLSPEDASAMGLPDLATPGKRPAAPRNGPGRPATQNTQNDNKSKARQRKKAK